MCVVYVCECLQRPEGLCFQELELQSIMSHITWMLEIKHGPLEEQQNAPNCEVISLVPYSIYMSLCVYAR